MTASAYFPRCALFKEISDWRLSQGSICNASNICKVIKKIKSKQETYEWFKAFLSNANNFKHWNWTLKDTKIPNQIGPESNGHKLLLHAHPSVCVCVRVRACVSRFTKSWMFWSPSPSIDAFKVSRNAVVN